MKLVTADKMRELEKRADASGNSYAEMMERAGTLTAQALTNRWPAQDRRVLVLTGPGNNGGDGLVCGRVLHDAGARVALYLWKREPREDDVNFRLCRERGITYARAEEDQNLARLKAEVARADFIVDAFIGTGVARPIEGLLKDLLDTVKAELRAEQSRPTTFTNPTLLSETAQVNRIEGVPSPQPPRPRGRRLPRIIAVDLPTGLNPDTGALDPAALNAQLTVTFAFPKLGQFIFPGAAAVGELVVADIGIAPDWASDVPLDVATPDEIRTQLPKRPRDSNKGTYGKALLACGSIEFTGAPTLAAAAAGRVGAGLVTLAVPRTIFPIVTAKLNEATYLRLPDEEGAWLPEAVAPLVQHARDYEALLVGCGMGRARPTQQFVETLFRVDSAPSPDPRASMVIDADALNALAELKQWWTRLTFSAPPILTPHPGEMARLIDSDIKEVQRARERTAMYWAEEWQAVVVLKGAFTVISAPQRGATLIPFANAALATAGTGDVLAGAVVGFLAQFRAASIKSDRADKDTAAEDAFSAARVGGYVHGLAGEMLAREIGPAGTVAGDLLTRLPEAIRQIMRDE